MNEQFSLVGQRALVTGANSGIGQAIAVCMASAGATVVCAGRSPMGETLARIKENGAVACALELDLSDPLAAASKVSEQDPLDILVNNAGIIRRADAIDFDESDWDSVMDVNLKALFFVSQAFARSVFDRQGYGRVINIASLLSFQGGIRTASYTASKSAVAGLTKLFANEWGHKGINTNAIAPGYIKTKNTAALQLDKGRNKAILERIPAGRWGKPDDIGGAAVFLASRAADYVNGAILNVDGGWLAR